MLPYHQAKSSGALNGPEGDSEYMCVHVSTCEYMWVYVCSFFEFFVYLSFLCVYV